MMIKSLKPRASLGDLGLPTEVETWEAVVPVSGPLPRDVKDWPAHLQDQLFMEILLLNQERLDHGLPRLTVSRVDCRQNPEYRYWEVLIILQTAVYVEEPDTWLRKKMTDKGPVFQ